MPHLFDRSRLLALLPSAGLVIAVASAAFAADEQIVLRIDGAAGTRFAATCKLNSAASGKTSISIDEKVPFKKTFSGSGLRCHITAHREVEIEVVKGGSRSFSSTSGGGVTVSVGS